MKFKSKALSNQLQNVSIFLSRGKSLLMKNILEFMGFSLNSVVELIDPEDQPEITFRNLGIHSGLETFNYKDFASGNESGKTFGPRFYLEVQNVFLDSLTGITYSSSREIISDSSSWSKEFLSASAQLRPGFYTDQFSLEEDRDYVCLSSNGYYHWLVEDFPLYLATLRKFPKVQTLIYKEAPAYVRSALNSLGVEPIEINRFIRINRLIHVSRDSTVGWPIPSDIKELRQFAKPHMTAKEKTKKVYISRLTDSRSPSFESELVKHLEENSWQILNASKMSLSEQIHTISSASTLAGVHGAGLSGIVWLNPGANVIELGTSRFVRCFNRLSAVVEVNYEKINFSRMDIREVSGRLDRYMNH
jgi:hypothetical protein